MNSRIDLSLYAKKGQGTTIVVSKKVVPLAVDRNRIKRLIREAVRHLELENYQVKAIVKKNFADAKMTQVKDRIAALLK